MKRLVGSLVLLLAVAAPAFCWHLTPKSRMDWEHFREEAWARELVREIVWEDLPREAPRQKIENVFAGAALMARAIGDRYDKSVFLSFFMPDGRLEWAGRVANIELLRWSRSA